MKVVVLTPIPTPYRDPFWNVVQQQDGVDLHVLYCAAGKSDRPWSTDWSRSYPHEVLPGRNLLAHSGPDASCYWNPSVCRRLSELSPDVLIVGGYNHLTMLSAIHWAIRSATPYYLMSETYYRQVANPVRQLVKQRLVRWVVRHMAGGFPTGRFAADYLARYGADPDRLVIVPNVPDVQRLQSQAGELRERQGAIRRQQGVPDDRKVVLFVGRLIVKKNAEHLLRAFASAGVREFADLVIVGDGPLRGQLETLSHELGIADITHFLGFVQPGQISQCYAMADLFVLPSAETWGVVVLEAVASGLPVIVSDRVGCHPDVVTGPAIGDVFPLGDVHALADALCARLQLSTTVTACTARDQLLERFKYTEIASSMVGAFRRDRTSVTV